MADYFSISIWNPLTALLPFMYVWNWTRPCKLYRKKGIFLFRWTFNSVYLVNVWNSNILGKCVRGAVQFHNIISWRDFPATVPVNFDWFCQNIVPSSVPFNCPVFGKAKMICFSEKDNFQLKTMVRVFRGPVRGVSGVSIDTPRILEISTAEPQFQSFRRSIIWLTPQNEIPNGASGQWTLIYLRF